jgi:hypothetical protein
MTELHAMCPDDVTAVEDTYPVTPLQHGMLFHGMQSLASGVDDRPGVICPRLARCSGIAPHPTDPFLMAET